MPGFGRRKHGGASQDQVMAVDVQLENDIRLDDQTARADAYGNSRSVLVRYQVPRSWVIGATSDTSTAEDVRVPSSKHTWPW